MEALEKTKIIPVELKFSKFKYHFIYVGALSQRKGIDILLKAYSKIDQDSWGLILVGKDTFDAKYHRIAETLNIVDKVFFIGAVDFNKVNEYLSFGDVFILPSRFDGWGAVLNEAASLSMPIISTDQCGAAYHLIDNDENGYRVTAASVSDLFGSMMSYVISPKIISKHGDRSLEIFEQYLPEKNVARLISALEVWS